MEYNATPFFGAFTLNRPLTDAQAAYLKNFSLTRRIKRDVEILKNFPDPIREAVGLPLGHEGAYYVGTVESFQNESILDYNTPPDGQPGFWCKWIVANGPRGNRTCIQWNEDENEEFLEPAWWLRYIIVHFLEPWGYSLNGEVKWYGNRHDDFGRILVENNQVLEEEGRIIYE